MEFAANLTTYRDLLEVLRGLGDEQLNQGVVVYQGDGFGPVGHVQALSHDCEGDGNGSDIILRAGQLYLVGGAFPSVTEEG